MNFNIMLDEAYNCLELKKNNKLIIPTLIIEKIPTRLYWSNTTKLLEVINRSPEHIINFLKSELANKEINWFSNNINDGLIIHDKKIKKEVLSNLILKYVNMYVICSSCKSSDTILNKYNSKKYEFECENCKMTKII
jgi:translation initiation factor 2 beta subunit (eIF-2beta)/eIF-5